MDAELSDALAGELDDWIEALPAYQQEVITQMLEERDPISVSLAWLGSTGPANTEPFGAIRNAPTVFFNSLLMQLQSLLCSDKDYVSERKELIKSAKAGHTALVTAVAGFVAPHVGVSPVFLAPAVALILAVTTKSGQDSICVTLDQLIKDHKPDDSQK